jgi:glycosyltransferase involved in cell wall biosynthesis
MNSTSITPDSAVFIVVSFEGPDSYSQAGGLGVRVSGLVQTLAELDFETHLFFIGDPVLPGEERRCGGRLVLHRWAQWISTNCPGGVYHGEEAKVADVTTSLPSYLIDHLVLPAIQAGRIPILLFEEWQTAECVCRLSETLAARSARDRTVLAWNANNPYGFERIDWLRLAAATTITTISRHMRSIVRSCGADARIIPNGIPESSFEPVNRTPMSQLNDALDGRSRSMLLFKMARWQREKGWTQALDAIRQARTRHDAQRTESGVSIGAPVLVARSGGPTGQGNGLVHEAASRRLRVVSFDGERQFFTGLGAAIRTGADVVNLRFGVSPSLARVLFSATGGVLANSVSEPFGLVGLEAMAAGGIVFTGGTGEDYAIAGRNAVVLETLDPMEIVTQWQEIAASPELAARLRRAARRTARGYHWHAVACMLIDSLAHQARRQGLLSSAPPAAKRRRRVRGDVRFVSAPVQHRPPDSSPFLQHDD